VTILVDECRWPFRGRLWCHLISDTSFEELHQFVGQLGIPRVAFQGDHYDLHETGRAIAIAHGALPVSGRQVVNALRASGLRRGPGLWNGGVATVNQLPAPSLRTDRLLLRQWTIDDVAELDPEVSTAEWVHRDAASLAIRGFGRWAVERLDSGELIGSVGLRGADPLLPFPPSLELGARIHPHHQKQGFGPEAARAAIQYGFDALQVTEILAFIATSNSVSLAAAKRIGMQRHDNSPFEHPRYDITDPNRWHDVFSAIPERK
jgi:RimJ/RimL family protein N-acetyltransferase